MTDVLKTRLPILASALVIVLGISIWWQVTLGFKAFTWESWRVIQVDRQPVPMPAVSFQDQNGKLFSAADLKGQVLVVNFIYTRCATLCRYTGSIYGRLYSALDHNFRKGRVRLLSVSLDPSYDTPEHLREYLGRYINEPDIRWLVTRPKNDEDGRKLITRFGVVSIPDGFGGIKHNAAAHIVDQKGRLVQIIDESDYDQILKAVDRLLASQS